MGTFENREPGVVDRMPSVRYRVFYEGRVQGVGFRMTSAQIAKRFPVRGMVRNLHDGRVELLVEGESEAVDGFLDAVKTEFGGKIHSFNKDDEPADESIAEGFTIGF